MSTHVVVIEHNTGLIPPCNICRVKQYINKDHCYHYYPICSTTFPTWNVRACDEGCNVLVGRKTSSPPDTFLLILYGSEPPASIIYRQSHSTNPHKPSPPWPLSPHTNPALDGLRRTQPTAFWELSNDETCPPFFIHPPFPSPSPARLFLGGESVIIFSWLVNVITDTVMCGWTELQIKTGLKMPIEKNVYSYFGNIHAY